MTEGKLKVIVHMLLLFQEIKPETKTQTDEVRITEDFVVFRDIVI